MRRGTANAKTAPFDGSGRRVQAARSARECAAAAAALTGRAAVAVICDDDRIAFDISTQQISQMRAVLLGASQAELLVEITIVQGTAPIDADEISTHHMIEIRRGEVLFQQPHIIAELAPRHEGAAKALDWHVGQSIESIELHPEMRK